MKPARQIVEAARRDLRSDIPQDIAWRAFRAAEYRLRDLVPDLTSVLESPPPGERFERHALIAALFDAAVQLNADVPPVVLLELLPSSVGFQWPAAANLLVRTRPAGFAAALLADLPLHLQIAVSDEGRREPRRVPRRSRQPDPE